MTSSSTSPPPSAPPSTVLPPIRAFLFDMDGLLLNSEIAYSQATNTILARYNRPPLPWSIKSRLQGRPGPSASAIFHAWAQLPISHEEFTRQERALQADLFPTCAPLPGAAVLLEKLARPETRTVGGERVHIALATSSHEENFRLKTAHLQRLFGVFAEERRVLGDDARIGKGRGKPAGDIYVLALKMVNETRGEGERVVLPEECLVLEDSVAGVEAGRRAGMRVCWVPDRGLKAEFSGREELVLAGRTGEGEEGGKVGEVGDGWAVERSSLEDFPLESYGVVVGREEER